MHEECELCGATDVTVNYTDYGEAICNDCYDERDDDRHDDYQSEG